MAGRSLDELMAAAAADAVHLARTHFREVLDYSETSVAAIERMVDGVEDAMPDGRSPETVKLLCRVWGAYIGEVLRRNEGGDWIRWKDRYGETIAFRNGALKIFPRDKVCKRFEEGAEHDLVAYYRTFRREMSSGK